MGMTSASGVGAGAATGNGGTLFASAEKPSSFDSISINGKPATIGLPPDGAVCWELGTREDGRVVLRGRKGTLYLVPEEIAKNYPEAVVKRDAIRAWAVRNAGNMGDHYGGGNATSSGAGSLTPRSAADPNKGQTYVDALKNILAGFASGGLSAGDVERGIGDAERALGQPGALADGPRANLKAFIRQGKTHLSEAASASSATVKALESAIGHFDRSGHSAQARSQLNDALVAARNASKNGWSEGTQANFKSYDKQASKRLWPSESAKSPTDSVERFLERVGAKPQDVQRAIATAINASPGNQMIEPGKALVGSAERQAKPADIKRLIDRSLNSFVAQNYPAFRGKVSSIEQLAYYKGPAADALWGQLAEVAKDASSGRFISAKDLLSEDGRKQAAVSQAMNALPQYGPGNMSTQQRVAVQQQKSNVKFAQDVSKALWPGTVSISLLDPDVNAAMTPPDALTKAIDSVNPINFVMDPIRKLFGTDDPLAPGSRATSVPRMLLSELNKSIVASGGKAIQIDGKGSIALPNNAQGGEILALLFFGEAGLYGSQFTAVGRGPDIAKLSHKVPLSPSFVKAYEAKSKVMSQEIALQAMGNIAMAFGSVGESPVRSQAEPLLRSNSAGGARTTSSTHARPNETRPAEPPSISWRAKNSSNDRPGGETLSPQKPAETGSNPRRPLSSQVYSNQFVPIKNGVNFANLGEFKLRSLEALSQAYGVPVEQLRVMVYLRHGESVANKGKTFAGNDIGLTNDRGWQRPSGNAFTSLPNGELMGPGGQIPLSQLGVEQAQNAQNLVRQLRNAYNIQTLEVSPVLRAQQTAKLVIEGQPPFAKAATLNAIAERGMGGNVHKPKKVAVGDGQQNIDMLLDRPSSGYIGGPKLAPDTDVVPRPGAANPSRPVEDRTGFESVRDFEGRQSWAFWRRGGGVASDIYRGNTLQVSHQYSIAGQLKAIDPTIDTMALGHGIPNGQPLVVIFRVEPNGTGQPNLSVLDAGYFKGR